MDLYEQVQEIDERLLAVEDNQVTEDIDWETMSNMTDYMRGNFWDYGSVTLLAGTATVIIPGMSPLSVVTIGDNSNNKIFVDKSIVGQVTFTSTSGADSHSVDYFIIFTP